MHGLGTIIALNKKAQDEFDGKPRGGTSGITLHHADGRSQRISAIRLSGMTDEDREKQGLMPIKRKGPISVRIPR